MSDGDLVSVLQRVGLADLPAHVGGLDVELKWKGPPSLDEVTSALDAANERLLYARAAAARIDIVGVGTREGLLPFHDVLLELLGDGHWRISRSGSRPTPGDVRRRCGGRVATP